MVNKINISIPKPCTENWNQMTVSEKGKFCAFCQKNVIDFTGLSDREILKYYNQNTKICGRFKESQLNRNLLIPKEKNTFWMLFAASILSFLGVGSQNAKAQEVAETEQTDKKILNNLERQPNDTKIEYSGFVYDNENSPLPGANISIKGSKKYISADFDGKFLIKAKKGEILEVSYIGFENVEIKLFENLKINVIMKEEKMMLGDVVIIKRKNNK